MAKINKEYQARMDGMIYAHNVAKEKGIDALTKEIKMRNILKADLWARSDEVNALYGNISINCYTSIMITMLYTLNTTLGFGKDRLHRLKGCFDKNANGLFDVDRWGEPYETLGERERFLREKYGFDFSDKAIEEIEDTQQNNKYNPEYKRCELSAICDLLDASGYNDAASFLREKELMDSVDKHYAKKVLTLPKYQEYRKRFEKESVLDAFYAFCFVGCEFLESKCQCTKGALMQEFLKHADKMLYGMDEQYYIDKVAYYKQKYNVDVLEILECEIDVPIQELETNL